jgi:hypothetical protein
MAIKCEGTVCFADCGEKNESKDCDSGVKNVLIVKRLSRLM